MLCKKQENLWSFVSGKKKAPKGPPGRFEAAYSRRRKLLLGSFCRSVFAFFVARPLRLVRGADVVAVADRAVEYLAHALK